MTDINILQKLKNADKYRVETLTFDIPLDGNDVITVMLKMPDLYEIMAETDAIKQEVIAEETARGKHQIPFSAEQWKAETKDMTPAQRKNIEKDRPLNMAEYKAYKTVQYKSILEIIPRYLRNNSGKLIFQTNEQREEFKELVSANPDLFVLLANKYVELFGKLNDKQKQLKN